MKMKRLVTLCFVAVCAFFANAQTIQLTPLELGGSYVQHIGDKTVTVSKVPDWKKTAKSKFSDGYSLSSFMYSGFVKEDSNWVKIKVEDFASGDSIYSFSLSKDSSGNVWIVYKLLGSTAPQLYAMLDCDINTIEDLVGSYWVSWKLIDGTKDIYPVLHKE